jgi:hypothetical protein
MIVVVRATIVVVTSYLTVWVWMLTDGAGIAKKKSITRAVFE